MLIVFLSALIFGFVHPGSKIILDQGIPLSYFCLLYIGIRLVVQIPFLLKKNKRSIKNQKIFHLLIMIGLLGALLQFFEFKGVADGLPPAVVTFLMYSYPLWILFVNVLNQKQSVGGIEFIQSIAVVLGIFFIGKNEFIKIDLKNWAFFYSLGASFLIAAWIILSNRLRKEGVDPFQLSGFYDLFSLFALIVIFSGSWEQDWMKFKLWSQNAQHLWGILLFSILIGLIPNFLFYLGSRQISSHLAGTILAIEPIFSSIYSVWLWPKSLGNYFVVGAFCILMANIPKEFFNKKVSNEKSI